MVHLQWWMIAIAGAVVGVFCGKNIFWRIAFGLIVMVMPRKVVREAMRKALAVSEPDLPTQ